MEATLKTEVLRETRATTRVEVSDYLRMWRLLGVVEEEGELRA
jgi:hypothetical protein